MEGVSAGGSSSTPPSPVIIISQLSLLWTWRDKGGCQFFILWSFCTYLIHLFIFCFSSFILFISLFVYFLILVLIPIFIVVLILILVFFSLPLFFSILIFILTHELCAFFFFRVCSRNSCTSFFHVLFNTFHPLPLFSCLILVHLSLLFPSSPFLPSHFLLHFISILICRFCRPPPAPSHSVVLSWSPKFPLISASYICNPVHNPR